MENVTFSSSTIIPHRPFYRKTLLPVGCLAVIYIACIWVFAKCKKMAKNIRMWFQHILSSNMISFLSFITSEFIITELEGKFVIFYRIMTWIARAGLVAGIGGTFALGCERLCSLIFPMRYQRYNTNGLLLKCMVAINIVSLVASSTVYVGEISFDNVQTFINTTEAAAWTTNLCFLILSILTVIVYSIVGYIALRKKRETPGQQNDYSDFLHLTIKCFMLVVVYIVLVLPPTICDLVCLSLVGCPERINDMKSLIGALRMSFFCCLPPVLIASSYASRFIILMKLLFFHKSCRERLEMKYKQRYATFDIFINKNQPNP